MMTKSLRLICGFLAIAVMSLSGCAGFVHPETLNSDEKAIYWDNFVAGKTNLDCNNPLCAGNHGFNRNSLLESYTHQNWSDLALKVIMTNYNVDQNYYYLGRAAEGIGEMGAAKVYYDKSIKIATKGADGHACKDVINNCDGFVFPDNAIERLHYVEEALARQGKPSLNIAEQSVPLSPARVPSPTPSAEPFPSNNALSRIALVIANSDYKVVPALQTPGKDAALVAESLRRVGFTVTVKTNVGRAAMEAALKSFSKTANHADIALVYFAGHGIEVRETNYLVPVDATLAQAGDVDYEAVPLPLVLRSVEGAHRLRLVVLDACRNNPYRLVGRDGTRSVSNRGLARIEPEGDTLVVYAAKDGTTAADGVGNSPFAKAFAKEILIPGQEVRLVFGSIRDDVLAETGQQQQPFVYGSLGREKYYFVASP